MGVSGPDSKYSVFLTLRNLLVNVPSTRVWLGGSSSQDTCNPSLHLYSPACVLTKLHLLKPSSHGTFAQWGRWFFYFCSHNPVKSHFILLCSHLPLSHVLEYKLLKEETVFQSSAHLHVLTSSSFFHLELGSPTLAPEARTDHPLGGGYTAHPRKLSSISGL